MNRINKKFFVGLAVAGMLVGVTGVASAAGPEKTEEVHTGRNVDQDARGQKGRSKGQDKAEQGEPGTKAKGAEAKGKAAGAKKGHGPKSKEHALDGVNMGHEQRARVKTIVADAKVERREILGRHGGDHRAAKVDLKAHREATRAKIKATLSAEQARQLDHARANRKKHAR